MTDWVIEWLTDSVIDWLTDLLIRWLTDWLMIGRQWLIDWLIYRPCEKSVLITLLKFTLAMILLPISCIFLSKKIFFEGNHIIFGTKSTEVFLNFPFHSQDFNSNFPKFHIFPYIFLAVFVLGICFSTKQLSPIWYFSFLSPIVSPIVHCYCKVLSCGVEAYRNITKLCLGCQYWYPLNDN